ncbi:MAG: hypothetical protein HY791_13500 [Deltaproteobacteria bacterium]|nr:hypothetical protein [Deltaproteobacteria bacterium]
MKRTFCSIGIGLLAACGGTEVVDPQLVGLPDGVRGEMIEADDGTATLVLHAASVSYDMDFSVLGAMTNPPPQLGCNRVIESAVGVPICTTLAAGVGTYVAFGLCIGDWSFTDMSLFSSATGTCTPQTEFAPCTDILAQAIVSAANNVPVTCTSVEGGDTTLDVACSGNGC